jgi:hypothetical protein
MVRSFGFGTLVMTLAGLAWGQPAAAPTPAKNATSRIIEVAENGGPKQKCKILKEWVELDGARAFQVEVLDTGEILTMVTSGPVSTELSSGNRMKTMTTRIFHWGKDKTPPPNAPVPPAAAVVHDVPKATPARDVPKATPARVGVDLSNPAHVGTDLPKAAWAGQPPIIQTQATMPATPKPAPEGRVWPPAFGTGPTTKTSALTNGPMLPGGTIIQTTSPAKLPAPIAVSGAGQPIEVSTARGPACPSPYQVSGCASGVCQTSASSGTTIPRSPVAANSSPYQASGCVSGSGSSQPCVVECPQHGACLPCVVQCTQQETCQPCVVECPQQCVCQPCVVECPQNGPCQTCVPVCSSPYQSSECPCQCVDAKPPRRTLLDRLRGDPKPKVDCCKSGQPCTTEIVQGDGSIIPPGKLPDSIPTTTDDKAAAKPIVVDEKTLVTTTTPDDKSAVKTPTTPQPKNWRDSWHLFHRKTDDKANTAKTDIAKKSELPQADAKRADPLTSPEAYTSKLPADYDSKPKSLPPATEPPVKTVSALPPPKDAPSAVLPAYTKNDSPAAPAPAAPAPAAPPAAASSGSGVPLGAVSVAEAGHPPYLPVSVVTLPPVQRMPAPPPARVPQAPQPNQALLANAFSAPMSTSAAATTSDLSVNAFSPPAAPASETAAGAFSDGYSNVATRAAQAGYGRMAYGAYPPGYGPTSQQVYMPGYGPGGYPPVPFNGAAQPNYAQAAPMGYGPTAGAGYYSPMNQGVMPAGYHPPVPPYQPGMASVAAAYVPQQPTQSSGADPTHLLGMLRESMYPSEREWAADKLAAVDWRSNGQIVQALVQGAKEDPAPAVRAGCVRSLGLMNVNTVPVVAAVTSLKSDTDPRVQREVEQALARLAPGQQSCVSSAVQPASAVMPAKSN